MFGFIGNVGPWELALVLVIVLVIFGPGKLPKVGESIGKALKGFKKASESDDEDEEKEKENKKQV
ncbi:MAG: twin-arginine translocase TatA/TatE family subunit [Firmicutes bacterium]|nr:twin-arginine translocase TatA/TatE family subunit [Bacillota bacterium]